MENVRIMVAIVLLIVICAVGAGSMVAVAEAQETGAYCTCINGWTGRDGEVRIIDDRPVCVETECLKITE